MRSEQYGTPPRSWCLRGACGISPDHAFARCAALLAADDAAAEGRVIRAVTRDPSALRARLGTIASRSTLEVVSGELSAPSVRAGGLTHILAGSARVFLCLPQALSSAGRLASDRPLS